MKETISVSIRFTREEIELIDKKIGAHNLSNPPVNRTQTIKWAVLKWARKKRKTNDNQAWRLHRVY